MVNLSLAQNDMWTRDMKIGVVYPTGDPEVTFELIQMKVPHPKQNTINYWIALTNCSKSPKQMKDLADGKEEVLSTGRNTPKKLDTAIALHEQLNYEIKTAEGKWVPLFFVASTSTQVTNSPASKPRQFSSPQKPTGEWDQRATNQPTTVVSGMQQKKVIKRQIESFESSLEAFKVQLSDFEGKIELTQLHIKTICESLSSKLDELEVQFEDSRQISTDEISELKKEIESINDSQEEFDGISDEAKKQLSHIAVIASKSEAYQNSIANQLQEINKLFDQGEIEVETLKKNRQKISKLETESKESAKNIVQIAKLVQDRQHVIEQLDQIDSQLRAQENIRDDQDRQRLERNCLEATERLLQNRVTDLVGNAFTERLGSCRSILDQLNQFTEKLNTAKITPPVLISNIEKSLHQTIQSCELTERKFRLPSIPAPEEFHHDFARSLVPLLLSEEPPEDFPTYETLTKQRYWDSLLDYKDLLYEPNFKEYVDRVDQETKESVSRVVVQLAEGFSEYRDQTPQDKKIAKAFTTHFLPAILAVVDLEIIPLEVGVTMADSQIHEIQGTTQGKYQSGVIAEVVMPGLRQISDQTIVRKPIVFRGIPLFSEL